MSDRIAVFNAGRIEQVGHARPRSMNGRATAFVAGFVGTSNLLTGEAARAVLGRGGTWSVRPEKVRLVAEHDRVDDSEHSAVGTIGEVIYAGSSTRYLVDLDAGARLTVQSQNLRTSSMDVVGLRGTRTRLVWERAHEFPVT